MGNVSRVNAVQINYADQDVDSNRLGKFNEQYHQYKLYYSVDGKKWNLLIDKSKNKKERKREGEKTILNKYFFYNGMAFHSLFMV